MNLATGRAGGGYGSGSLPLRRSGGITPGKIFENSDAKSCILTITRLSSGLPTYIHSYITRSNFYATQPLQCQNQRKLTYHAKNSTSNTKFQEFSRFSRHRSYNFPYYPPDNHHSSDVVYWRGRGQQPQPVSFTLNTISH